MMLLPLERSFVLAEAAVVALEATVLDDVWMLDDDRVETPVGAFWLVTTPVTASMGMATAEKVVEDTDEVAEEAEDER